LTIASLGIKTRFSTSTDSIAVVAELILVSPSLNKLGELWMFALTQH